jgi:hypothetical protein
MVVHVLTVLACIAALCFPVATFANALREVPNATSRRGGSRTGGRDGSGGPDA